MATHFSILAWEIPWMEEPGRLQSMGLQSWTRLNTSVDTLWSKCPVSSVTQSCLTLSDPMDCSLLGSFIHGIFQARVLE